MKRKEQLQHNFESIQKKSFTKFFWVVWDNLTLLDTSIFEYRVSKFEEEFVHVFKNTCNGVESYFGGVALFPKNCKISSKEFQYKFYLNKKEHDVVASKYRYPIYIINSYQEYTDILKNKNQEIKILVLLDRNKKLIIYFQMKWFYQQQLEKLQIIIWFLVLKVKIILVQLK